jgi:predicted acetyltransferase
MIFKKSKGEIKMDLKLVRPSETWFDKIREYQREFRKYQENRIPGSGGLQKYDDLSEWLRDIHANETRTLDEDYVPGTVFTVVPQDGSKVIGTIQIRHVLNKNLLEYGGHIGYAIRPEERQKEYGTKMLGLALSECLKMGLDRVLITCDRKNVASAKVIQNNGGRLENELFTHNEWVQRYWITINHKA